MRYILRVLAALLLLAMAAGAAAAASTPQTIFAPLWVYPPQPRVSPVTVVTQQAPPMVVIRDQPPLLTPADLRFSVETENGVTVVRGPRAR
jgi:hypothetical protein